MIQIQSKRIQRRQFNYLLNQEESFMKLFVTSLLQKQHVLKAIQSTKLYIKNQNSYRSSNPNALSALIEQKITNTKLNNVCSDWLIERISLVYYIVSLQFVRKPLLTSPVNRNKTSIRNSWEVWRNIEWVSTPPPATTVVCLYYQLLSAKYCTR